MKRPGVITIWPSNIDAAKTRSMGRVVPRHQAVKSPTVQEIKEATGVLGVSCQMNPTAALPRNPWDKSGYVIVEPKGMPRKTLLFRISEIITKLRTQRSSITKKSSDYHSDSSRKL